MKKWIFNGLIIVFTLILIGSAAALASYYIGSAQHSSRSQELAVLHEAVTPRPSVSETPGETVSGSVLEEITDPQTGETVLLLPELKELYLLNNHIVGWIQIPGTDIDYPVMQTPDEPDYYLTHNFDREYSQRGAVYASEVCDIEKPSDNITLYGHRMRDGTMFAQLDKYTDPDFYAENPYIYFDTLTQLHTYQVMAVFLTTASQGEGFAYHLFVDAAEDTEFTAFVSTCRELSLYDTGVMAEPGDTFITLSTCEYSQTNGRLVIVAKRVS